MKARVGIEQILGTTDVELPGVEEGGMPGRNEQRKPGTTRGSPRRSRTAKASRISRDGEIAMCLRVGRMGPISDDVPGHYNPEPSEGPWGRRCGKPSHRPDTEREFLVTTGRTKDGRKPGLASGTPGAGLTGTRSGKAPSDRYSAVMASCLPSSRTGENPLYG